MSANRSRGAILILACAIYLAVFTVHYQIAFMGHQGGLAWYERVQWERTQQVMHGEQGTPWQYRLFTDSIVYGTVRLFEAAGVPRPIGTAFVLIRMVQNILLFTLAAVWYQRLGAPLLTALFGVGLLAWGMCHGLYDTDMTFNTYTDLSIFLGAALLIQAGRFKWLVPLMVAASFNRETSGCIPFMLLFSQWQWRWRPLDGGAGPRLEALHPHPRHLRAHRRRHAPALPLRHAPLHCAHGWRRTHPAAPAVQRHLVPYLGVPVCRGGPVALPGAPLLESMAAPAAAHRPSPWFLCGFPSISCSPTPPKHASFSCLMPSYSFPARSWVLATGAGGVPPPLLESSESVRAAVLCRFLNNNDPPAEAVRMPALPLHRCGRAAVPNRFLAPFHSPRQAVRDARPPDTPVWEGGCPQPLLGSISFPKTSGQGCPPSQYAGVGGRQSSAAS